MDPNQSYKLDSSEPPASAVLPRYVALLQDCRQAVLGHFSGWFTELFEQMDEFMLTLAENAETNAVRSHCFEVMHEILLQQNRIQQVFGRELERGFENFMKGVREPLRAPLQTSGPALSLIEKDDFDVALAYSEIVRRANESLGPLLMALDLRLAVLNGGARLGDASELLPGSPAQVCDAMRTALDVIEVPINCKIRVDMAGEFESRVVRKAGKAYGEFNDLLIKAGILPNLSLDALGYRPSSGAAHGTGAHGAAVSAEAAAEDGAALDEALTGQLAVPDPYEGNDSAVQQEIFRSIQQILAARHMLPGGGSAHATSQGPTDLPNLMNSLNSLQLKTPPLAQMQFGQMSLESVKESFASHVGKLAELVETQQVASADADIIDLVGMLFEFILNDGSLPDSVKALLSHLHTPILKVALLDRKFFFRSKHPARRLLNALAHAGAQCSDDDGQAVFAELRSVVERIVQEFDDDTNLFETVLEEFQDYMDGFGRKSKNMEKRVVESAKGRERLREARQCVSQEIVDRTWDRNIPKPAENLLMGPWANLMVLTYLRNGKDSEEWESALKVVDDLIWSVEPKPSIAEQALLRDRLPKIHEAVRHGLAMVGDPEVNTNTLLQELDNVYNVLLKTPTASGGIRPAPAEVKAAAAEARIEVRQAPPKVQAEKAIWEDLGLPDTSEPEEEKVVVNNDVPEELSGIVTDLKSIKLGTWFEFYDPRKKIRVRGKLSWYSPKTSYYIFVDQGGLQVAVKSLKTLTKEMAKGEAKVVNVAKRPFVDRALESLFSLLKQSPKEAAH